MKANINNDLYYNSELNGALLYLARRGVRVNYNYSLKNYTSFRIGGNAEVLVSPQNEEQLYLISKYLLKELSEKNIRYYIIGGGSNLLIGDGLLKGIFIRINFRSNIDYDGNYLSVCGSESISRVITYCSQYGLSGLEFLSGIPGTIGGSLVMNAGTNSEAIGEAIVNTKILLLDKEKEYSPYELGFSYRSSYLQGKGSIVLRVVLKVKKDDPLRVIKRVRDMLTSRRKKQPLTLPSAGSVFKNPPNRSAGALLEEAGVKGLRIGGAQVSYTHANFIVNIDDASAQDVLSLMKLMQETTKVKSGVELEPEIIYLGN